MNGLEIQRAYKEALEKERVAYINGDLAAAASHGQLIDLISNTVWETPENFSYRTDYGDKMLKKKAHAFVEASFGLATIFAEISQLNDIKDVSNIPGMDKTLYVLNQKLASLRPIMNRAMGEVFFQDMSAEAEKMVNGPIRYNLSAETSERFVDRMIGFLKGQGFSAPHTSGSIQTDTGRYAPLGNIEDIYKPDDMIGILE